MQFFTMNYLTAINNQPRLDRRIVGYGMLCTLAIAACITWVIA